ncbi:MAG: phosphate ABC transporter substrate-binding/OmpA family protein [Gammaproteobacteria bacterium]|nr:phosphate ABC transporter substrate-binding/OmpA family protein [Gammaproteobacteria bacterium]
MKRLYTILTLLITITLAYSNTQAQILFSIQGSNTIGSKLAPQLAKSYLSKNYQVNNIQFIKGRSAEEMVVRGYHKKTKLPLDIEIKAHGSSTGFVALENGSSQICMSSRPIKDKEIALLSHLGNLKSYQSEIIIGLDGIAVIIHKSNPLASVSRKTLTDIFSGKITTWGEVDPVYQTTDLKDKTIRVYSRDDNSGTYDTFKKLILVKGRNLTATAKRYESNADLSDQIASDPAAIGFVSLPNIRKSKALAVSEGEGSARLPNNLTVATEDYILARRLYLYVSEHETNADIIAFLDYVSSEDGQNNVNQEGFISQNIYTEALDIPEFYPEEYRGLTSDAKRLSVNIHFIKGSLTPDNKAKRSLIRIAEFIKSLNPQPKSIMLFGFSEDTDFKMHNISLSESRADYVELLLKKQGITINRIRGFGSVNQVADNTRLDKNRRVEIWIK